MLSPVSSMSRFNAMVLQPAAETTRQPSSAAQTDPQSKPASGQPQTAKTPDSSSSSNSLLSNPLSLTEEQKKEVEKLQQRDQVVRTHEQAHIAAGGNLVRGGATFDYQAGPDGKRYAVGGEVQIDTSPVEDDPQATINKANRIRRAALAPADPSAQDISVAGEATRMVLEANQEMNNTGETDTSNSGGGSQSQSSEKKTSQPAEPTALFPTAQKAYQTALGKTPSGNPVLDVFSA